MSPKQTASAVFVEFTDNGAAWPTLVLGVLVGQVNALFTVLGKSYNIVV